MAGFGVPDYSGVQGTIETSIIPDSCTVFANCRLCLNGSLVEEPSSIIFSKATGRIVDVLPGTNVAHTSTATATFIDLDGSIVAPGFLELQTNGMRGFHFTHFEDAQSYQSKIDEIAKYLPSTGVTGFWATIPTVSSSEFKKILPSLRPRAIIQGAALLGAHAEGPYLHPSKKGAHNSDLFHQPSTPAAEVYGGVASSNETLKLVTIAPELEHSASLITDLVAKDIRVSLGHSSATLEEGIQGLQTGASCLTHTMNAMTPLHHRNPGLAGLVLSAPSTVPSIPWFSIIPDGNHLHPAMVRMLFRSNPSKCIVITDSIEMAGLEDGTYPGHAQIPYSQTKEGSKVVIEGTDTLIGGCASLSECVRNVKQWSECSVAEAVRCVTENIAEFMEDKERGKLEEKRLADLVVLDDDGNVLETWMAGKQIWRAD